MKWRRHVVGLPRDWLVVTNLFVLQSPLQLFVLGHKSTLFRATFHFATSFHLQTTNIHSLIVITTSLFLPTMCSLILDLTSIKSVGITAVVYIGVNCLTAVRRFIKICIIIFFAHQHKACRPRKLSNLTAATIFYSVDSHGIPCA